MLKSGNGLEEQNAFVLPAASGLRVVRRRRCDHRPVLQTLMSPRIAHYAYPYHRCRRRRRSRPLSALKSSPTIPHHVLSHTQPDEASANASPPPQLRFTSTFHATPQSTGHVHRSDRAACYHFFPASCLMLLYCLLPPS